jgi:small subunit ribosomal protein S6
MLERYISLIKTRKGIIHRREDWGRRPLAYPINKLHKAHYVLLNIECDQKTHDELDSAFRYNDAILRYVLLRQNAAMTEPSPMMKGRENLPQEKAEELFGEE